MNIKHPRIIALQGIVDAFNTVDKDNILNYE
jgi:hypothetical protein